MSLAKQLNDPTLTLGVIVLFAVLGFASLQPCVRYPLSDYCMNDEGYDERELKKRKDEQNAILFPDNQKLTQTQRAQLMSVWNLTEADVAKPVNLWGKE